MANLTLAPAQIGRFSDEERARSAALARRRYVRFAWRQAIYAVVFLGVFVSGLSRTMSTQASDTGAVWNIAAACLAIGWVIALPVAVLGARDDRREGLTAAWQWLPLRSFVWGFLLILAGPAWLEQAWRVVVYGYGEMLSTILWFPIAVLVAPLIVTASSRKIDDPPTVARMSSLIHRSRVRLDGVRIRKVARATRRQNAFVMGVWPTRRLVVFDTLAADGPLCLDAAVAHELGHMRLHHTIKRLAFFIVVTAVVFVATVAVVGRLPQVALWRPGLVPFHRGFIRAQVPFLAPDPTYVPLVLLLWGVLGLLLRPLMVAFVRKQEHDADLFGVRLTRDPLGFSLLLQRLALSNLADLEPGTMARLLFATHGSIPDRIAWVRAEALPPQDALPPPPVAQAAVSVPERPPG
jgi:Zn-dependent protease with chaperone function